MRSLRLTGWLLVLGCFAFAQSPSFGQSSPGKAFAEPLDLTSPTSIYLRVQLEKSARVSALKPGDAVEGRLAQDVYSGDRELFPAGSPIHLTVDKLGRRRREANDHWPWIVKVFTPRHETYPTFQAATITTPTGDAVPLRVSLIFINREKEIRARSKSKKVEQSPRNGEGQLDASTAPTQSLPAEPHDVRSSEPSSSGTSKTAGPIVTLEAANPYDPLDRTATNTAPMDVTLDAGTKAKMVLLGSVSASKSRPGDAVEARLVEPVLLNSKVALPEGTLLRGKVVSRTPPRMLSRAGSILLVFTDLVAPGEARIPITASVTTAELDQKSHTKIDAEGKMHGDRPGKAWMAINLGVTAGIAKEADDTIQLIIEALVSSATDVSTAGAGRIVAGCASGLFLITRHGRDVVLPRFTEMSVVLDRPLHLTGPQPAASGTN